MLLHRHCCRLCSLVLCLSLAKGANFLDEAKAISIRQAVPTVFKGLAPFNSSYRNPCFKSTTNGRFECLPAFFLLGVPKAGTSELYERLMSMPQFARPGLKEPHYWAEPNRQIDRYLGNFRKAAKAIQENPELMTTDSSTETFTASLRWEWADPMDPDESLLPRLIKTLVPDSKTIVILRNPVDRLYSAYWFFGCWRDHRAPPWWREHGLFHFQAANQNGTYSPEGFHDWATENLRPVQNCLNMGESIRRCARLCFSGSAFQLIFGLYITAVRDWLKVYEPHEIKFINFEVMSQNQTGMLLDVIDFLGLNPPKEHQLKATESIIANRGLMRLNKSKKLHTEHDGCDGERQPMLDETRSILEEFYHPYNIQLAQLLGDDAFAWT